MPIREEKKNEGLTRGQIYRDFLKAKGRYDFVYGRVGGEEIDCDEEGRFRKIIDGVLEGQEVMCLVHFVWVFGDTYNGNEEDGVIDKIVEWDYGRNRFVVVDKTKRYRGFVDVMVENEVYEPQAPTASSSRR